MSTMVTVRVGKDPEAKSFFANEALLTSHSEFFRHAMNGRWEEANTRTVKLPEYDSLIHLYVLVDKLQNRAAKNAIVQAVFDVAGARFMIPGASQVNLLYKNTTEQAPLRALLVDLWSMVGGTFLYENAHKLPTEFLRDLLIVMQNDRKETHNIAKTKGVSSYFEDGTDTTENKDRLSVSQIA
jgi:hypothetical protein